MTLTLESISRIPFQARASDVKIPKWRQHCSNHRMPCLVSIFGTLLGTGHQPDMNPGTLVRCAADIILNIANREILQPVTLVARNIVQVGVVSWTNDWHNRSSSRKLILRTSPPIASVHLGVYSARIRVCEAHQSKIEVRLKWAMCQKELYTLGNIPVV